MRVSKVLKAICGFGRDVVIVAVEVIDGPRRRLVVDVRPKRRRRGQCGRCGEAAAWLDNGGEWRLTNGIAESNNASIGRLRTNARSFHDPEAFRPLRDLEAGGEQHVHPPRDRGPEAFITMILLDRAHLAPNLPWTT